MKKKNNKNPMNTFSANPKEVARKWYLIDATDLILGRVSVIIADILRGKNKPIFTPNQDCGDFVVVINAEKVALTGDKLEQKKYYHHTRMVGHLKEINAKNILSGNFPERLIKNSVKNMINKGPLRDKIMKKLFIYSGVENPHSAQKPELIDVKKMNKKNSKKD